MEPTKPTGTVLILAMVKEDLSVTKVHLCHDYALLCIGNVIR
jgi:hypothetical protein